MIWGGGGNFQSEFIFSGESLPYKNLSLAGPLKIFFFPADFFLFPPDLVPVFCAMSVKINAGHRTDSLSELLKS